MKTEIVLIEVNRKEIDWSKVQLVECSSGAVVLTDGLGIQGEKFSGSIIIKDHLHQVGEYSNDWSIVNFSKVTEPLTIKFIPNETI